MAVKNAWTVVTKNRPLRSSIRAIFAILAFGFSLSVNAIVITFEPDDFHVGDALENSYVTTGLIDGPFKDHVWNKAIVAQDGRDNHPDYKAPTGTLIFGAFSFAHGGDPSASSGGLGIKFHQDVLNITFLANSIYPPGDLSAVWMAFDIDGNRIASGYAGGDRPASETFSIDIGAKGVRSIILGGDYDTSAICFDRLTFEVEEIHVPEPAGLLLLALGLLALMFPLKSRAVG
ncbi:MAG TPA: hypothetical protein VLC79_03480 [Cellvibrio sp.]|nr:hypothetical protein [Cellvibrio sp.]